jgi:hypothetical protein
MGELNKRVRDIKEQAGIPVVARHPPGGGGTTKKNPWLQQVREKLGPEKESEARSLLHRRRELGKLNRKLQKEAEKITGPIPDEGTSHGARAPIPPPIEGKDETALSSETVKNAKRNWGGINTSYRITFPSGMEASFKPVSGELSAIGGGSISRVRNAIRGDNQAVREVASAELAGKMGMRDLVAASVMRDLPDWGGKGALTKWINSGAKPGKRLGSDEMFDGKDDAARAAAWDYLIDQTDRHTGNWLMKNGKIVLIDHGLTWPTEKGLNEDNYWQGMDEGAEYGNSRFFGHARNLNWNVPAVVMNNWKDKWPVIEETLKKYGLYKSIETAKWRFDNLMKGGKFKDLPLVPPTSYHYKPDRIPAGALSAES